ncbi:MAG: GDSL-type esterase/lipase family protein, partial [Leptospirales bacterium]
LTTRIEADVLALRPRAIAISIGGNDILQGRCIDHTLDATRNLIQHIKTKSPGTKVLMTSVPPTLTWKANQIVPFYNWRLKYITEEFSGVEYIDLWREMSAREVPELAEAYRATLPGGGTDVIHFGEEGYRVWGELLLPYAR